MKNRPFEVIEFLSVKSSLSSPNEAGGRSSGSMRRRLRRRSVKLEHFTLIELLVVIAIIAILLTSESIFFMSVYVNGVLGKV